MSVFVLSIFARIRTSAPRLSNIGLYIYFQHEAHTTRSLPGYRRQPHVSATSDCVYTSNTRLTPPAALLVFLRRPQECASDYQEMVADKCIHCNKGIRKGGGFSGSFYPVDRKPGDAEGEEGEAKVHLECFEAYQAKLAEERDEKAAAPPETETATVA